MSAHRTLRATITFVIAALVLGACSKSKPGAAPTSVTTPAPTTVPAATTTSVPATGPARSPTTGAVRVSKPTHCQISELTAKLGPRVGLAGNGGSILTLTNHSTRTCTVYGYVGLRLVDADRRFLPTAVNRQGGMVFKDQGPTSIALAPSDSAHAGIGYGDNPAGTESYDVQCPQATFIEVTPPSETDNFLIDANRIRPCAHGALYVTALQRSASFLQ